MEVGIVSILVITLATMGVVISETATVSTPLGTVEGIKQTSTGGRKQLYTFMGIPYAKPPVGSLRFEKPVPYGGWRGALNASKAGPMCIQNTLGNSSQSKSEDCLFLNIYVPNSLSSMNNKSVMVWIHGGAYRSGSGDMYDGSTLAVHGDVIVVTCNYRLGIFGFLSLDNNKTLGNYGLWDQMLALKWVNKYISFFGGNPSSVTIFGESAGGFSVSLQSLIPANKGLFQRVISQSGVANSKVATTRSVSQLAITVASKVSCTDPGTFLECLRRIGAEELNKAYTLSLMRPEPAISFRTALIPIVDNELFFYTPQAILSGPPSAALDFFKSLDLISGNCNSEGTLALINLNSKPNLEKQFHFRLSEGVATEVMSTNIAPTLVKDYFSNNQQAQKAICDEYCVYNNNAEQGRAIVDMFGDLFFISPAVYNLIVHSTNNTRGNSYQYTFSKQGSAFSPKHNSWFRGAPHAAEVVYLFNMQIQGYDTNLPPDGHQLAEDMKTYWTNFAKYGNPNGGSNMAAWPAYDPKNRFYLRLDNVTRAEMDYRNDKVRFWLKDIPDIVNHAGGFNPIALSLQLSSILGR